MASNALIHMYIDKSYYEETISKKLQLNRLTLLSVPSLQLRLL